MAGPRCNVGSGSGDCGLQVSYSAPPPGYSSATPTMMQCSDTRCHLANCPELPSSEPGFNSSCQQCLAERAEMEERGRRAETSFSPEARGHYTDGVMMDSSLSASVLSTKNLVSEASSGGHEAELETRGRGEQRDSGPGRTYECEDVCRQSTRSVLGTLGLSVIILGYLALGAVTFASLETRALEAEAEGGSPQVMNSNDLLATLSAEVNTYIDTLRGHTVSKLWDMTEQMNILYPINWTHNAAEELLSFQHMLSRKLAAEIMSRPIYPNAKPSALGTFQFSAAARHGDQWGFSRGFLYSLSLLTTIGM